MSFRTWPAPPLRTMDSAGREPGIGWGPAREEPAVRPYRAFYRELISCRLCRSGSERFELPDFPSFPYEWCFSQLKDAALLTLEVQVRAFRHGLTLAVASPFQVQFHGATPMLADGVRFEEDRGGAWPAYESFCRGFLAPLMLMSRGQPAANDCFRAGPEGPALEEASRRLGVASYLHLDTLLHIHLHQLAQRLDPGGFFLRSGHGCTGRTRYELVASLAKAIERLRSGARDRPSGQTARHDDETIAFRKAFLRSVIFQYGPRLVYDFSAPEGYARVAASEGCLCVCFHSDPLRVELAYRRERAMGDGRVLPLRARAGNPPMEHPRADLVVLLGNGNSRPGFGDPVKLLKQQGRLALVEYAPLEPLSEETAGGFNEFLERFEDEFQVNRIVTIPGTRRQLLLLRSIE